MCHYASDKKCADFSLKMHQKRLAAGLRLDPLGDLTALPEALAGFKEWGKEKGTYRKEGGQGREG